mgnify:CR=1 FL=1
MEYEKAEPDVEEMTEIEAGSGNSGGNRDCAGGKPPASVLETVDSLRTDDQYKSAAAFTGMAWISAAAADGA